MGLLLRASLKNSTLRQTYIYFNHPDEEILKFSHHYFPPQSNPSELCNAKTHFLKGNQRKPYTNSQ